MATFTFDTYELIKEFREVGFNDRQAEVQANALKKVYSAAVEHSRDETNSHNFATVSDLNNLESRILGEVKKVESHLSLEFEKLRAITQVDFHKNKVNILLWVFGMLATQSGLILGFFCKILGLI